MRILNSEPERGGFFCKRPKPDSKGDRQHAVALSLLLCLATMVSSK